VLAERAQAAGVLHLDVGGVEPDRPAGPVVGIGFEVQGAVDGPFGGGMLAGEGVAVCSETGGGGADPATGHGHAGSGFGKVGCVGGLAHIPGQLALAEQDVGGQVLFAGHVRPFKRAV